VRAELVVMVEQEALVELVVPQEQPTRLVALAEMVVLARLAQFLSSCTELPRSTSLGPSTLREVTEELVELVALRLEPQSVELVEMVEMVAVERTLLSSYLELSRTLVR
jgi:hypothetical protein